MKALRSQPGPEITDAALTQAWDEALPLAWEALKAETTPVGAVVVDDAGRVVGARSRLCGALGGGAPRLGRWWRLRCIGATVKPAAMAFAPRVYAGW